jgi:hypothetical protein
MTAEQRWILDLTEVLTLRLECNKCGTAIVYKPMDWREAPTQCPGCDGFWDLPHVAGQPPTALQQLAIGLKQLLNQDKAATKAGSKLPYQVKFEIRDPTMAKYGLSTDT